MITLTQRAVLYGPSPFARRQVIVTDLAVEPASSETLARVVSALQTAHGNWYDGNLAASGDPPESFVAFVVHLTFSALIRVYGYLHDYGFRRIGEHSFRVWLGWHNPKISFSALKLIADQCNKVSNDNASPAELRRQVEDLWKICSTFHPGIQYRPMMMGADAKDIPYAPAWGLSQVLQFGWGARSEVLFSSASNNDGFISGMVASNKQESKALLRHLALPTPDSVQVCEDSEVVETVARIGFPCVVKPADQVSGKGISVGLRSIEQVRSAVDLARRYTSRPVMIEQFIPGADHRLMVAEGRFIGAFRRDPTEVAGDGARSIRELVERLNVDRALPGTRSVSQLAWLEIDEFVEQHLARQGLSADTVLARGQRVTLRGTANIATGGTCTDVTANVHPDIRSACEMLARTMKINLAGFDYVTPEIGKSWHEGPGAFIELNLTPGLDAPTLAGWPPEKIGAIAIGSRAGRIPLDCIVVEDGLLAEVEAHFAGTMRSPSSAWAGHEKAQVGHLALKVLTQQPWAGITAMLANRAVERAYALISGRQLQRFGFPVDRASRVWLCDPSLPPAWQKLVRQVSETPLWQGDWQECMQQLSNV